MRMPIVPINGLTTDMNMNMRLRRPLYFIISEDGKRIRATKSLSQAPSHSETYSYHRGSKVG